MFQGDYTMSISLITENYLADVIKIQKEAYTDIAPEDVNILKNKWHSSPQTCAVYLNHKGKAIAYLLALEGRGKNIAKALVQNLIENAQVQSFVKIRLVAVQNSTEFWAKFSFINMPLVKKFAQVMVKTHN